MRYAELFGKTRRDALSEISDGARRLAFRAGLIRVLEGGQTVFLPLGTRVLLKIKTALRLQLEEWNAQLLHADGDINLSTLAAQELQSYKYLPARIFWLDAGGARLHVASFEANRAAAAEARKLDALAARFFETMQVDFARAADVNNATVWYAPSPEGDMEILRCTNGDYAATRAVARANKENDVVGAISQDGIATRDVTHELPLQEIATPHCDTIDSLAQFLGVPTNCTAKAVFYSADGRVIFAVVRGDLQIDEEKVKRALGVSKLRFATDDEIQRVGAVPGYASPVGVRGATIIADDSVTNSSNLVAGANRADYHLLNTNVPRDYQPDIVADIALARAGDRCPNGDGQLELARGIPVGRFSEPRELAASFLDANGRAQKPFALKIEIDCGATLLAFLEKHHDEKGIIWIRALAPFDVHIVALNADKPEVAAALAQVTAELERAGKDYLLDDRNESAGVKFNDADLIGLPIRLTVGPRTVAQNAVEVKRRDEKDARLIPIEQMISTLK